MLAPVVVMLNEHRQLRLKIAGQVIMIEQFSVRQGLVPTLDLALRHRMIRSFTEVLDVLVAQPAGLRIVDLVRKTRTRRAIELGSVMKVGGYSYHRISHELSSRTSIFCNLTGEGDSRRIRRASRPTCRPSHEPDPAIG